MSGATGGHPGVVTPGRKLLVSQSSHARDRNHWPVLITLALALVALTSDKLFGQIELSYLPAKSLVGATSPRVIGDRILIGDDSKPQVVSVAIIKVASSEKVRLKARKTLYESVDLVPLSTTEYMLAGEGKYLVEAISLSWDRSIEVTIGGGVDPEPTPDPKPIPPVPPKPDVVVPNDYNVGAIAYKSAPKDVETANKIASWYRIGASKLFGQGGLQDIGTILKNIDTQFANKTCRDQVTCEHWGRWKLAVSSALQAEQSKRGTFTRQDFYTALVEVATALEAIK